MNRELVERRSFRNSLETYLSNAGWSNLTFSEGWSSEDTVITPLVNVYFVRKDKEELEIGRTSGAKIFNRLVQVDCYMETEDRASGIADDVMDFMELSFITITDFQSNTLGTFECLSTNEINSSNIPPIVSNPNLLEWRSVTRGPFRAYYPNG